MTRAVVFDVDGTLADTPGAITALLVRVVAEHGVTADTDTVAATIGKPLEPSVAALLGRDVADPVTVRAVARYRELFDTDVLTRGAALLYPGVTEGLGQLVEQGFGLAVATSKISASAEKLLAATGIRGFFGPVIGNDMVERGKPDPQMGLLAARELGLAAEDCAYVGDTVTDMLMAAAAGMRPVAVTYGVGRAEDLAAHTAWRYDSFAAAVRLLTGAHA
ncbi:HAD family hydrolase [Streptomyces sp. NPDC057702]|uniref:HAD family hydrolase n=1 Tax=unclassified Streptomyces TaxID=2593676 RepID=UPI0036C384BA